MKKCDNLKDFLKYTIAAIGSGYIYIKISYIKKEKTHKKEQILEKIKSVYNTNLTRNQRTYRKNNKGLANFLGVEFNNCIVILHTRGEIPQSLDIGKGWVDFTIKNALSVEISEFLTVNIYRDERQKLTVKLDKSIYRDYKNEILESFKTRNGNRFHKVLKKVHNLPKYRGFQLQKRDIIFYINNLKKDTGIKWNIGYTYL
ncbi:hypothetical protein N5U14_03825 [Aliarcobacter butzleri]|uniref:hypothetical protein n=1 Tax=Aliarcobacter butzleri TaxID=28197 RepID=UPI0021B3932D|nr:hypothetical protein [Aliarcobacter butzleri]MCT7609972.1 hypothetical protein [Aliarcobacter butzleri]